MKTSHSSATPTTGQVDGLIKLAVHADCPVLITGPSVRQREAIARLIHRGGEFVRVDCTSLDDSVFASALDHTTVGTLFLDEIDAMSPPMQARLSRFLEQQAIRRASHSSAGLVRIIAGSDGNLMTRIAGNQFSATLFYRLNLIHIQVSELSSTPGQPQSFSPPHVEGQD
jgi:DNA-binding NtrC family response regulator